MKIILSSLLVGVVFAAFGKGNGNTNNIYYAASVGNLDRVKQFLAANPGLLSSRDGAGILTTAAVHGQTEVVAFLISKGADVNEKGFFGMTPVACMGSAIKSPNDEQFADVATLLIAHGAER